MHICNMYIGKINSPPHALRVRLYAIWVSQFCTVIGNNIAGNYDDGIELSTEYSKYNVSHSEPPALRTCFNNNNNNNNNQRSRELDVMLFLLCARVVTYNICTHIYIEPKITRRMLQQQVHTFRRKYRCEFKNYLLISS